MSDCFSFVPLAVIHLGLETGKKGGKLTLRRRAVIAHEGKGVSE